MTVMFRPWQGFTFYLEKWWLTFPFYYVQNCRFNLYKQDFTWLLHTTCRLSTVWLFIYFKQNSQMYIFRSRWNSSGYGEEYHVSISNEPNSIQRHPFLLFNGNSSWQKKRTWKYQSITRNLLWKVWTQESFELPCDRPRESSPKQEDAWRRLRGICGFKKELRVCWMEMEVE